MSKHGENIYKRKDGRWEARYLKGVLPNGKKQYGSVYAKSYNEVKAKQLQYIINPAQKICDTINFTVSDLMSEWLDSIKNNVKPNTYQKYESLNRNHIEIHLGSIFVKLISNYTIRNFTSNLINSKLSNKTINDILVILHLAFKYSQEEYGTAMPKISYLKVENKSARVLTIVEQQLLMKYLKQDTDVYKFAVILALYTGLRIGELCALQWEDITEDYIKINKTMMRLKDKNGKTEIKIGSPKSKSSKRIIPTPQCLLPLINQYRKQGYVLSNSKHKFIEPRLLQWSFEKIVNDCGLDRTSFHTLRHTFATRCVEAGVDIKTLSEILGHSDVKTTLNKYVHSSFELKQKGMAQLELLLIS